VSALSGFWRELSARERWALGSGAVAVSAILLYALVWAPWHTELRRLREHVPVQRDTLTWMQQQARAVKPLIERAGRNTEGRDLPLLTVVEQTAREAGLREAIRQMQPGDEGEVRIWIQDAYFDPWLLWTEVLRKRGIESSAVTVNRSAQLNRVNIRMTLERAG
jgi:general secretion pathway protein M